MRYFYERFHSCNLCVKVPTSLSCGVLVTNVIAKNKQLQKTNKKFFHLFFYCINYPSSPNITVWWRLQDQLAIFRWQCLPFTRYTAGKNPLNGSLWEHFYVNTISQIESFKCMDYASGAREVDIIELTTRMLIM